MKHYVINLKDKPNRLAMWVGGQYAQGFSIKEIKETVLCYGIDGRQFDSVISLADLAISLGIDWQVIHDYSHHHISRKTGHASLRLGIDLILHDIKTQPSGWYAIWHDDEILNMPYSEFLNFFEDVSKISNVQVVATHTDYWIDDRITDKNSEHNKRAQQLWASKESRRHPDIPLYRGCVGSGFDRCLVLTPEGAKRLLEFGEYRVSASYEILCFHCLTEAHEHFWSTVDNLSRDIGSLLGSDIEHQSAEIPMQEIRDLRQCSIT